MAEKDNGVFTLSEEQDLEYTQSVRKTLLRELIAVEPGGKISDDPDRANLLLTVLRDVDKTNLAKANTRVKNKAADGLQDIGDAMAEILTATSGYGSNKRRSTPVSIPKEELAIELVADETFTGVKTFTYEEMIQEE